tara:strand:+ start:867 stop:1061 length:195 start_codon:yes stop_codon:yes gene_type:complete
MTKTKYILDRIEVLEKTLRQPAIKNKYLRRILKPIIRDWEKELRSYRNVEFKQKNVEQLYATNE